MAGQLTTVSKKWAGNQTLSKSLKNSATNYPHRLSELRINQETGGSLLARGWS